MVSPLLPAPASTLLQQVRDSCSQLELIALLESLNLLFDKFLIE